MRDFEKVTLTVEETAKILGIGRSLCYRMVKEGKIPYLKFANRIVIPKVKLYEMINQ